MVHPDRKVRESLAQYQPNITAEQWARLILGEPESRRWVLVMDAAERRAELDEATYERLATDPSPLTRCEATRLTGLPSALLTDLALDDDPGVRYAACSRAWPHLDDTARLTLLSDQDEKVRTEALIQRHRTHPMSRSVFEAEYPAERVTGHLADRVLETCRLERDLAEHLARHGEPGRRRNLASNPCLDLDLILLLGQDPDDGVRFNVSVRPELTEEQRVAVDIDFDFDPNIRHYPLEWVFALHDDPAAMRRLAASSHFLVRRNVARAKHLPPDVVELLARDEDRVVQLFLAESCDDAPADMLLRVWQWWTGSLTVPGRPHGHPNFPRADLLRYADDPNPRMRQLALDDPESTPELVERFSRDRDAEVRYRAAKDPRLTPAAAVRLLDDAHEHVRHAVVRHPGLPARTVVRLLRDHDTAAIAASHPALPVPVMEQMIKVIRAAEDAFPGR